MLLALFALVLIWSLASVFILAGMVKDRQTLNDRVAKSLSTIFEYQTRYDGVYELAYPGSQKEPKKVVDQDLARSKEEALANIKEAIEGCLEVLNEQAMIRENAEILEVMV